MRRTLPLVCLLLLPLLAPPAEAGPIASQTLRLPLGIADGTGEIGFLPSAIGGIEAVDLATGDVLWTTIEAQRPLLVASGRLYTQAGVRRNRLRVLVFDVKSGECLLESDPVVLPRWVVTDEGPGHAFTTQWRLERRHLVLSWEARTWAHGAAGAELSLAGQKQTRGLARIDLDSGKVELRSAERRKVPPVPSFPAFLENRAVRWHGVVGPKYNALVLEEAREPVEDPNATDPTAQGQTASGQTATGQTGLGQQPGQPGLSGTTATDGTRIKQPEQRQYCFMFYSWDRATGRQTEPVELIRGEQLLVRTSLDEHYLFVRNAPLARNIRQMRNAPTTHSWTVVSAATGKEVAHLQFVPGTESVLIVEPRAYCLVSTALTSLSNKSGVRPRTFQALDLKTNQLIWERPVEGKPCTVPGR